MIRIPRTRFKLGLPTPFASLPRRLSFFAFATTLITSLAVTLSSVHSIHGFLREKIDQKFPAILGETSAKLDRWYDQRLSDVETLAGSEILVDKVGRMRIAGAAGERARSEIRQYIAYVLESFPLYDALFVRDRQGNFAVGVGDEFGMTDGFAHNLPAVAESSVGDIERLGSRRVQLVSAKVRNRRGSMVGSLHARLRLDVLDELLSSEELGASGEIYLVGREGAQLTPTPTHPLWDQHAQAFPSVSLEPVVLEYTKPEGERMVGAAVHISRFGWSLVVEERYADAFAPALALINRTVAINLAIVLLFGMAAYRIALSIAMPIEALSAAVQRVAEGETDAFVPQSPNRDDEVGILTRVFNDMTGRLHQNRLDLQKSALALERANTQLREQNEELQGANETLEQLSITDALTKLHNHRFFQDTLTREAKRSTRSGEPLALLLIDVDDFKQLNDAYGHAGGDAVLRHIAAVMNRVVRETDLLARYGGEEFAVIATRTDLPGAVTMAEMIRSALAEEKFVLEGVEQAVTVSIGAAIYQGKRDALFADADRALYTAKESGKDCVVAAEPKKPRRKRRSKSPRRKGR